MHNLELVTAPDLAGATPNPFQVRAFTVTEAISTLFRAQIDATHPSPSVDFACKRHSAVRSCVRKCFRDDAGAEDLGEETHAYRRRSRRSCRSMDWLSVNRSLRNSRETCRSSATSGLRSA